MVTFTALVALLASTATLAAPLEPRGNEPNRIQALAGNTRVGNLCLAPGEGETEATVILKSCSDPTTELSFVNGKIVFASGVAEVLQGANIVQWVQVRPDSDSAHQTWTRTTLDGAWDRFESADGCLTVHEPLLPGPARLRITSCSRPNRKQDFKLI